MNGPFILLRDDGERGYTLVETAVALALLLTLLLPMAVLLTTLTTRPDAARRMEALALAQHALEDVLRTPPADWQEAHAEQDGWTVETAVERAPLLAVVTVRVVRGEGPEPLVTLMTARYVVPPRSAAP